MKIYNSLTRKIEQFTPIKDNEIKIYVCGITPYDTTHLGHAFTYVMFDVLVRFLTFSGYKVTYTQNVTDIDDDILKKAKKEKRDWRELGDFWTKNFLKDMKSLNVLPPTHYVKATDSIVKIVEIVQLLIDKGFAYEREGNVYFDVDKFKDYGNLSHYSKGQMMLISKERGADPNDPNKKNPLDFVLWQKFKDDEPYWNSPFGKGRPGWHIECSAMIHQYLGETIYIHGGGRDLIFPHHESEIAQSESYTGKKSFVKYWMHTAMVIYQGEKMSKSLGNLVMVSHLLKKYSANEIRYVLLSHHYRKPWEFEEEELKKAKILMQKIVRKSSDVYLASHLKGGNVDSDEKNHLNKKTLENFEKIMNNDFDVPKVLLLFPELLKSNDIHTLIYIMRILGFSV
ncbi:MAG: cysteine--tRNA ligase [bacterium]|nr:cysteine--tRNA ligase [bacterium]